MRKPNKGVNADARRPGGRYAQRLAVEVSIEKYEKTAMQWLQEQTQNN